MDNVVGMAQAKSNLAELVGQVAYGRKRFVLERRGRPVAVLIGMEDYKRLQQLEDKARKQPLPPDLRQYQEQIVAKARQIQKEIGDPIEQLSRLLSTLPSSDDLFWSEIEEIYG